MHDESQLQVLIPVYDDWESVRRLLPLIGNQLQIADMRARVLLVDDGSTEPPPSADAWREIGFGIESVKILTLHRNLGHQRAICVALCFLREHTACDRVLVMDGDGEDDSADIPRLLAALEQGPGTRVAFAERLRRSEGWLFSLFYSLYRALHRVLVGQRVRVGNFSVMNRRCLESLCTAPELWNHYAASVFATRQPMAFVPTRRAKRLAGRSKMNFPALVMHGLSALSVFSDRISTRLLIASFFTALIAAAAMVAVVGVRLATPYAIPGWATFTLGILAVLLLQIGTFILTFCFTILSTRGAAPFIPIRDYHHFVRGVDEVWRGAAT